ncbi:DNA end-binding protein Ku [Streptomyces sp. LamerLS-316]|uniref:non-homologous end joining protein Ku n=1 Tax=unclassified Streptomyces TaxID=2593676 RepID=UPI000823C543|nr:Ku protein [Streptomyces sp. LamerLS-316]MYQ38518.1 Ku protein [Streptomyces sp. SID4921]SCK37464.1 DNA end-binding protein Ku [Streptomyces sp. LamerLS-316]
MRSIWNGSISFGLVSIPVKLMNATENHAISFRQIHLEDGGRIRYRKVCELDEEEVPASETVKAYEDADGTVIPVTDEDLASLPLPTAKTIEIEGFVPASAIDPLQLDSAYYLAANGVPAAKPYALLREALRRSGKVAVAKYALRGRERLGMLRVSDDVIAMHALLWPDEIRAPEGVAPDADVKVRDAELDLADALMNTLGDADMDTLHDDYREAVEELVAAKAAGEPVAEEETEKPEGKVIDLMAALENSVRAAKESQGEDGEVADVHPIGSGRGGKKPGGSASKRAPSKKTGEKGAGEKKGAAKKSAEKATAKKAPAKKAPAKKAAAKETASTKASAKKTAARKTTAAKKSSGGTRKRTSA